MEVVPGYSTVEQFKMCTLSSVSSITFLLMLEDSVDFNGEL